jgi:hypothetical protein
MLISKNINLNCIELTLDGPYTIDLVSGQDTLSGIFFPVACGVVGRLEITKLLADS